MNDAWEFFWLLLKASLLSFSGLGNLPLLHDDLLARGWATERTFAEALAVGQVSPGPTGLWVISLAYLVDGSRGAFLALLAISLPPLLVLGVDKLYRRVGDHPAVAGFVRGISLAVVGVFLVVLRNLLAGNGIDAGALLLIIGAMALALTKRVPVIVVLMLAALAGALLY